MAKSVNRDPAERDQWDAISARALCFLCLTAADLRDQGIAPQAKLLEGLGLRRKEVATMLGTPTTRFSCRSVRFDRSVTRPAYMLSILATVPKACRNSPLGWRPRAARWIAPVRIGSR